MKTHAYDILAELERHGVSGRIDWGHKHPRVYFLAKGEETFVTCAATASDSYRGLQNALADVRRKLGVTAARPKSDRVRAHRARGPRHVPALPSVIDVKADPFAVLRQHKLMPVVMNMNAKAAWQDFWDDCLRVVDGQRRAAE